MITLGSGTGVRWFDADLRYASASDSPEAKPRL